MRTTKSHLRYQCSHPRSSQKKASENSPAPSPECSISLSPSKTVDLRMKNLQQLRYLRQLLDDNILTAEEYQEQKLIIVTALRKLE